MDAQVVRQAVRLRHLEQIAEPRPTGDQRNSLVAMVYDHPYPFPEEFKASMADITPAGIY